MILPGWKIRLTYCKALLLKKQTGLTTVEAVPDAMQVVYRF
jgi:hypothetical protein